MKVQSEDIAGLLLDRGASALAVDAYGARPSTELIKGFYNGVSPLVSAACYAEREALEILLGRGAAINAQRDDDGYTALHRACWRACQGKSESAKGNDGRTALPCTLDPGEVDFFPTNLKSPLVWS